jgi:hypothetical protein
MEDALVLIKNDGTSTRSRWYLTILKLNDFLIGHETMDCLNSPYAPINYT